MKNKKIFLIILLLSPIVLFCSSLLFYYPFTAEQLVLRESPRNADAIIILEGEGRTRAEYAIELLEKKYSKTIFFPGLQIENNKSIIQDWLEKSGIEIDFFYNSGPTSTYEEAIATKKFVNEKNISSILLVTSGYHSYRATWIFRKVLPRVNVISTPVPDGNEWFSLSLAHSDQTHKNIIKTEQMKFLFYYVAYGWRLY